MRFAVILIAGIGCGLGSYNLAGTEGLSLSMCAMSYVWFVATWERR